ncbi:uncharacterized protein DFL_003011 [Arthrobotrys flagrans]|uniref:Peptidase A1 domain-containing protein n=1 Tax=Arthrobotrys flagrans TaxID=97331 RepID=A0A437AC49_ARTFL|nr:hypothetical protein DFL_003011 [Arthrobotrys flagrans]
MGAVDFRVPMTILSLLTFLYYVTRPEITVYEANLLTRRSDSVSQQVKRANENHVLLPTECFLDRGNISSEIFTNVTFGTNTPLEGVSTKNNFKLSNGDYGMVGSTEGYWVEDTVTAGGEAINFEFGVATSWNYRPALGLGFKGAWTTQTPSYGGRSYDGTQVRLAASIMFKTLKLQGKYFLVLWIAASFRELDIYSWVVLPPGSSGYGGRINTFPTTRFVNLPNFVRGLNQKPSYRAISTSHVLEFAFNKATIRVPFNDLIARDIVDQKNPGSCHLFLDWFKPGAGSDSRPVVLGGPFFKAAYIVINPETNTTAIAGLSRNDTASEIVEIGGRYGASLSTVKGSAIDPSVSSSNKLPLPLGALIGIGVGGVLVLIAAIALGIFLYRRRKARKISGITSTESSPQGEIPKVRPTSDLEVAKVQVAVSQGLSSGQRQQEIFDSQRYELDARAGHLQELP